MFHAYFELPASGWQASTILGGFHGRDVSGYDKGFYAFNGKKVD